jgi:hypothetical protein
LNTSSSGLQNTLIKHNLGKRIISKLLILRKQYLIFTFFLAVATLAWYIRALNEYYTTELQYPVRYVNLPPNRILSHAPPEYLTLRIRADGYTILGYKLKLKRALRFNVNSFSLYSLTADSTSVYLLTKYTYDKLTSELNESNKNIQILDISPDTLFFNFSRIRKKKVPVMGIVYQSESMFARQHMLNGSLIVEPDSVIISGPTYILDTISHINTESIELKNEDDTTTISVRLAKTDSRIIIPPVKIRVTIPVDRFTESEFEVPIHFINVPEDMNIKTFPGTIQIKYLITLSNFNKISSSTFFAYIDYNNIDLDINSKLKIELDSIPSYVHNIKVKPAYVEFLIEKKSAKNWNNRRYR